MTNFNAMRRITSLPVRSRGDKYILENLGSSRASSFLASMDNAYLDSPSLSNIFKIENYHGHDPDLLYLKQRHEQKPENQKMSIEEFESDYANSGLEYDPSFTKKSVDSILKKRHRMNINNYIIHNGKNDLLESATNIAGSIIGGNVSPTNIAINAATGLVPVGAIMRGAWWAANPVKSQMVKYAIGGGIGQAALEPMIKLERDFEQREYGIGDSAIGVAESAAFSAILPMAGHGLKSSFNFGKGRFKEFKNRFYASPEQLALEYSTGNSSLDKQFKHQIDELAFNTHPQNVETPNSSYEDINLLRQNTRQEGIDKFPEFFNKEDRIASLEESLHREFATEGDITALPDHLQKILETHKKELHSISEQHADNIEFQNIVAELDDLNSQLADNLRSDQQINNGYDLDQVDLAIARSQLEDSKYVDLEDPSSAKSIFDNGTDIKNNEAYQSIKAKEQIKQLEEVTKNSEHYEQAILELEALGDNLSADEAELLKRNKLLDIVRFENAKDIIERSNSVKSGFTELLKQTDMRATVISGELQNGLMNDLIKSNNLDFFRNKNFEGAIAGELWNITHPNKITTNSKIAKNIAQIIHKWQGIAINRINNAGASIKQLDGYITRQSHNGAKMKKDGYQQWYDFLYPLLELDKLDADIDLKQIWQNLSTDTHLHQNSEYSPHFRHNNIADQFSQARKLHFKSASTWLQYNNEYGTHSLAHSIAINLDKLGRNTGLLEQLGSDSYNMLARLKRSFEPNLQERAGNKDKKAQKELDYVTSHDADNFLEFIIGNKPKDQQLASISQATRNIISMANLGRVAINSIPDLSTCVAEQVHNGIPLIRAMSNSLQATTYKLSAQEKKEFARLLAIGTDNLMGLAYSRLNVDNPIAGSITTATNFYFKLNLMNWWDDSLKSSIGLVLSNHVANNTKTSCGKANIDLKNNLARYGIDHKDWQILKSFIQKASDGNEYIIPPVWDINNPKANEVATKFRTYLKDRVDTAIATPHAAERYAGTWGGIESGTKLGEFVRFFMQFKQFPLTYMMRGMKDYKGSTKTLATMMGLSVVGGYLSIAANAMLNGDDIPELDNDILMSSALKGGGVGFYGDFIFGQHNRYGHTFTESMLGPIFSVGNDVAAIYSDAAYGNIDNASDRAQRLFTRHLPLRNLFYLEPALKSAGVSQEWIDRNLNAKIAK